MTAKVSGRIISAVAMIQTWHTSQKHYCLGQLANKYTQRHRL